MRGEKKEKSTNIWRSNGTFLKKQWVKEEIKREIKKHQYKQKQRHNIPKVIGHNKCGIQKEVYSDK